MRTHPQSARPSACEAGSPTQNSPADEKEFWSAHPSSAQVKEKRCAIARHTCRHCRWDVTMNQPETRRRVTTRSAVIPSEERNLEMRKRCFNSRSLAAARNDDLL